MFQLLSIYSPFFVLCHKNFIKLYFSMQKIGYMWKNQDLRKKVEILKN